LEAGFTGRDDKPQVIVDAFQVYWDITFAKVPMLEPAFTWGSSSTIASDEDNASDVTATSEDSSNPLAAPAPIKKVEAPSTPEAAVLTMSYPQRPSKTATTIHIFSPLAQPTMLDYNFVVGTASPPASSPSRLPRTPLRSPKKTSDGRCCSSDKENSPPKQPAALPSLLDRIAMASSPATPKLGKRRASNVPTDPRPKKKSRGGGPVARKSNDGDGDGEDRGAEIEEDSEAEREEVLQSLLSPSPATPSSAAQQRRATVTALAAFTVVPPRTLLPPCSRSPSPTPQPPQHKRKCKRKSVFMDAVEIRTPRPLPARAAAATLRKTRSASSHTGMPTREPISSSTSEDEREIAVVPGQGVRRSLRRAKSLGTFMSGAGVPDWPSASAATPTVGSQRAGKRQRVAVGPVALLALKTKKAWNAESDDDVSSAAGDDDDVAVAPDSSSPISAALKRARVLFGSGKSILSFISLHMLATASCSLLPSFFFLGLIISTFFFHLDDSMAAEIDDCSDAAAAQSRSRSSESSDDDSLFGQVTPHHIFSPAPRRMSSRFFSVQEKA
jgi:hypothetical protein